MKTLFSKGILELEILLRKIWEIPGILHEWVFRRKALGWCKATSKILEKEVEEKTEKIRVLTSGHTIHLNQQETMMVEWAIEYKDFRKMIEEPKTKAIVRNTWRDLREKVKLHLKKDREPAKDDDETTLEMPVGPKSEEVEK